MSAHTFKDKLAGLPWLSRFAGGEVRAGLNFEGETCGGRTVVRTAPGHHGRMKRQLIVMGTEQSAMWMDDPYGELVFPYLQLFDLGIDALRQDGLGPDGPDLGEPGSDVPGPTYREDSRLEWASPSYRPLRALMIGGGGFAWPRHVLAAYPEVCLDVVEIDQRMIDIAREYFLLDELEAHYGASGEGRLRVFQEDGRVYLAGIAARTYDVIVNDCFIAREPAASLADADAAVLLHQALAPGGIYLSNVVGALLGPDARPLERVTESLGTRFAQVSIVPCEPETPALMSNNVVIASDADRAYPGTWMTCRFAD